MPLTDKAIAAAKPTAKPYKMGDAGGLFLLVQPAGGKLWRLKYRVDGREKKLSLGRYPDVGLKDARDARDAARKLIAAKVDPSAERQRLIAETKREAELASTRTFEIVATEYIDKTEADGLAEATILKSRWLLALMVPDIGSRPVDELTSLELLDVLRRIEARGNRETAKRMRSFSSRVMRYAIGTGRAQRDIAQDLVGILKKPIRKPMAAIIEPERLADLLRSIEGYQGQPATFVALRLSPHVFVRPGELRRAEWAEIDENAAVWRIPAEKMKRRIAHTVPLSTQSLTLFDEARKLTGGGRYVFPSLRTGREPMSENTINAALRRLGYSGDEMTAHGFRSTASSILNESGLWHPDAIERALSHGDPDAVRAAYHRGAHWDERVRMAQWWSDYLDQLRDGTANLGDRNANR